MLYSVWVGATYLEGGGEYVGCGGMYTGIGVLS